MRLALVVMAALAAALPAAAAPSDPVVRLDGTLVATEGDLADWSAAQGCYGEDAITSRQAAFMRLTEAAIADAAMRAHGGPRLDDAAVSAEAARINRETRAPDILACIKKALGPGDERYRRVFVRPVLVESTLRSFLMRDRGVQAGPRGRVEKALTRAREGEALEQAAKDLSLTYSSAAYTLEASTAPMAPDLRLPPPEYQKDFIEHTLSGLKPGELRAEPIESDYAFQVVRLVAVDGPRRRFESATAVKASQEDWFKSLPKMRLEVLDDALRAWAAGIHGNPRLAAVEVAP